MCYINTILLVFGRQVKNEIFFYFFRRDLPDRHGEKKKINIYENPVNRIQKQSFFLFTFHLIPSIIERIEYNISEATTLRFFDLCLKA